jgi:multidrug efflux pump subunit AcrA (membrane-fusion protein)
MKTFFLHLFLAATVFASRPANLVILNENGAQNLRIETALAEESTFEESLFAIGHIASYPGYRAAVSSRISGRALDVFVKPDHPVAKGDPTVLVESRLPGNPPSTVEIPAPLSGLVSHVDILPGGPVEPDRILLEILDLSVVYAIAKVPESLAGRLKPGQAAKIKVPAASEGLFKAHLEHFGAEVDSTSGTVEAAFRLENPDQILRPGMLAEFTIVTGSEPGVFSIPKEALQGDMANRFVFVKDFELPFAYLKTPVSIGRMSHDRVEVLKGLFPADEVVTRGSYGLSFAGGGTLSLKEALDAAHGHEHAEDGSELAPEKSGPATGNSTGDSNPFWMVASGVLFVLLVVMSFQKRRPC